MATCVVQPKVMAHWSRHDPVMMSRGNSDHWAKMRMRSSMSAGNPLSDSATFSVREKHLSGKMSGSQAPAAADGDGRVDPVANAIASRVPVQDLHGNIAGNYASPHYAVYTSNPNHQKSATSKSASFRNIYQDRAKSGFEFWYKERPKPTRFGRYGIGSYKTLLGLGNAPRT